MEDYDEGTLIVLIVIFLFSSALGNPSLSVDSKHSKPSNYGTTETLNCTDIDYKAGNVYAWKRGSDTIFTNDGEVNSTGKYNEILNGTTFMLDIYNINVSDEGNYTCNHNFHVSNSLNLEVTSRGTVTAKLSAKHFIQVTFKQIYPNTISANITCDSNTVLGFFVKSIADGDRFTRTWESTTALTTLPKSCSASVKLRTNFISELTVTQDIVEAISSCFIFGKSQTVNNMTVCQVVSWVLIVVLILLGFFIIGIVFGCILMNHTKPPDAPGQLEDQKAATCCESFYSGESCKNGVSNNYCRCKCFDSKSCGVCCNIRGLPHWYQILWASIIGIPVALGILLVWKCYKPHEPVITGSTSPNPTSILVTWKEPNDDFSKRGFYDITHQEVTVKTSTSVDGTKEIKEKINGVKEELNKWGNEYTIENLKPGTYYEVKVYAFNGKCYSSPGREVLQTQIAEKPGVQSQTTTTLDGTASSPM